MGDAIALEKVEETVVLVAKMCISCLILGADISIVGANKKGLYMTMNMIYDNELVSCLVHASTLVPSISVR
jgi:hypothetical protein